jgi:peroxiredoxin Q/BCP
MIKEGVKAPDFCLGGIDEKGQEKEFCLSELLKGRKPVVLYFYPRDNTPGCTQEACEFRDNFNRVSGRAIVVGVSRDSLGSHKKFIEKYGLNFPLLSDPDHKVMDAYGVWGTKVLYGKRSLGPIRSTFIISSDGKIRKMWPGAKVKGHVDEVLAGLEDLS